MTRAQPCKRQEQPQGRIPAIPPLHSSAPRGSRDGFSRFFLGESSDSSTPAGGGGAAVPTSSGQGWGGAAAAARCRERSSAPT